jgi:hypothetical protein
MIGNVQDNCYMHKNMIQMAGALPINYDPYRMIL